MLRALSALADALDYVACYKRTPRWLCRWCARNRDRLDTLVYGWSLREAPEGEE